jgi:hypothetical protein
VEEKQRDEAADAKAQRSDIEAGKNALAAGTGNQDEAGPDEDRRQDGDPAGT